MTRPRKTLISVDETPYYHCVSRCVRRGFLCGLDAITGNNYEHRRQWVVDRLQQLSEVFAIDICAYAIMSNHHHLVVRINRDAALALPENEVIERWGALFSLPLLVRRYRSGKATTAEARQAQQIIKTWRARLWDLSWFMRCLNEHIARLANREDGCTGRFWEGRYKSQALLDEAALLTCMSYVDLNPIRACMAATPETSDFTSVQARIRAMQRGQSRPKTQVPLLPFKEAEALDAPDHLPFSLTSYLDLVDWTGRAVRNDKRGHIDERHPPILDRLGIDARAYLSTMRQGQRFGIAIGCIDSLKRAAERLRQRHIRGCGEALRLFPRRAT